jgi:hypothetical protein
LLRGFAALVMISDHVGGAGSWLYPVTAACCDSVVGKLPPWRVTFSCLEDELQHDGFHEKAPKDQGQRGGRAVLVPALFPYALFVATQAGADWGTSGWAAAIFIPRSCLRNHRSQSAL